MSWHKTMLGVTVDVLVYMSWFNFPLGTIWYFPLFEIHTPEQRRILNLPRIKLKHNIQALEMTSKSFLTVSRH